MKEAIMKTFECGTLVPGCTWRTEAEESSEVIRRAAEHLRTAHGEAEVRPTMVDQIKARVHDKQDTVH
jgi:predicted small metal-binding protein